MFYTIKNISIPICFILIFIGCGTAKLQTQTKMTKTVFLNPINPSLKSIYIELKNSSSEELNTLKNQIIDKLELKNYKITSNVQKAQYILRINILSISKKRENNSKNGAKDGLIIGSTVNMYNNNGATQTLLGGLSGALIGGLIARSNEDSILQIIVDVNIQEKTNYKITTSINNSYDQASINDKKRSGFINSFSGPIRNNDGIGEIKDNSVKNSSQTYNTNYIEKRTRIFAEAIKKDLIVNDAILVLEKQIAKKISSIF